MGEGVKANSGHLDINRKAKVKFLNCRRQLHVKLLLLKRMGLYVNISWA